VVFELRSVTGFDGVVTRVVGTRCDLVDQERACTEQKHVSGEILVLDFDVE
jgi:hypothetical protein